MQTRLSGYVCGILASLGLLAAALPIASFGESLPAILGGQEYRFNCASCHGDDGAGNGPMASELKTPPANLRTIAKNNGGTFPAEKIYNLIDGRETIRAHGGSEMPVWGAAYSSNLANAWAGANDPQQPSIEAAISGRILSLIYYLQSIQDI